MDLLSDSYFVFGRYNGPKIPIVVNEFFNNDLEPKDYLFYYFSHTTEFGPPPFREAEKLPGVYVGEGIVNSLDELIKIDPNADCLQVNGARTLESLKAHISFGTKEHMKEVIAQRKRLYDFLEEGTISPETLQTLSKEELQRLKKYARAHEAYEDEALIQGALLPLQQ